MFFRFCFPPFPHIKLQLFTGQELKLATAEKKTTDKCEYQDILLHQCPLIFLPASEFTFKHITSEHPAFVSDITCEQCDVLIFDPPLSVFTPTASLSPSSHSSLFPPSSNPPISPLSSGCRLISRSAYILS